MNKESGRIRGKNGKMHFVFPSSRSYEREYRDYDRNLVVESGTNYIWACKKCGSTSYRSNYNIEDAKFYFNKIKCGIKKIKEEL